MIKKKSPVLSFPYNAYRALQRIVKDRKKRGPKDPRRIVFSRYVRRETVLPQVQQLG